MVLFDDTGKLKTDDVWSYSITGGEPLEDGVVYDRPAMERTRIATGEKQKVSYEAANSIMSATDVLGNVTKTYLYKTSGQLYDSAYKHERTRAGESAFVAIWHGTYDSATGDLIRTYDVDDNETQFAFERFPGASEFQPPKKVTVTDPLERVSTFRRNMAGDIIEVVNSAGVKRKLEWDKGRNRSRKYQ